jgi:hypothetical protein
MHLSVHHHFRPTLRVFARFISVTSVKVNWRAIVSDDEAEGLPQRNEGANGLSYFYLMTTSKGVS